MRTTRLLTLAAVATVLGISCSVISGYSPEDPVTITVTASERLNEYSGEAHTLLVYAYKLDDPDLFAGADENTLLADPGKPVAGGVVKESHTFQPGQKDTKWRIGAMGQDRYKWVGIYAAYRDAVGSRRMVVEIPHDGELTLVLDPKGIASFK
jgi:type VI secretion system VasD/TssJ family lipoprotein